MLRRSLKAAIGGGVVVQRHFGQKFLIFVVLALGLFTSQVQAQSQTVYSSSLTGASDGHTTVDINTVATMGTVTADTAATIDRIEFIVTSSNVWIVALLQQSTLTAGGEEFEYLDWVQADKRAIFRGSLVMEAGDTALMQLACDVCNNVDNYRLSRTDDDATGWPITHTANIAHAPFRRGQQCACAGCDWRPDAPSKCQ